MPHNPFQPPLGTAAARGRGRPKSNWRTVRCVVEVRTNEPSFSERDLARIVQHRIDPMWAEGETMSKPWAKQFTAVVSRMKKRGPRQLLQAEGAVRRAAKLLQDYRRGQAE